MKTIPGREKNKYKSPEAEHACVCSRNNKEVYVGQNERGGGNWQTLGQRSDQ